MNPYHWPFPDRSQTMFLATINASTQSPPLRPSTFQLTDIPGTQTVQQIPQTVTRSNFAHSDYIEPRPQRYRQVMNKQRPGYQLSVEGIDRAYPMASSFKTGRVVDPLQPRYKLPYVNPILPQPARKLLRNTMDISDIVVKRSSPPPHPAKQPIQGSSPTPPFKTLEAPSRIPTPPFKSNRSSHPLQPQYAWRDQSPNQVNSFYGQISSSRPKKPYERSMVSSSLDVKDIQGASVNSYNNKKYFLDKRKEFRDYMQIGDIGGTAGGSLKKGISTGRVVNPLMPLYKYPE